jgi:hypothetical protein
VSEESDDIDQIEGNDDIDGEVFIRCGLAPNGTYKSYLDEDCTELDPGNYTYYIETSIGFWDGSPDEIVMNGLIVDQVVEGASATDEYEALNTLISGNLNKLTVAGGSGTDYMCFHE